MNDTLTRRKIRISYVYHALSNNTVRVMTFEEYRETGILVIERFIYFVNSYFAVLHHEQVCNPSAISSATR